MMRLSRLTVHLKCMKNSFLKRKASDIGRDNVAGFVEALRSFGTSDGYWLSKPFARTMQEKIVNALQLGERSRASFLLSELGRGGQALQAWDFICIFQYCSRTPDPVFVMETWRCMEGKDIELSGKCLFLIIRALCKGGYLKEAFNILSLNRENSDIYPTLPVYNNLLEACFQMNGLNHVSECLDLMEQQGVGKNAISYTLLLKLAVLKRDLSAVREIWKEYINCHSLSIIALRKFIWSFTRLRDLEAACVVLQQMVAAAFQNNVSITKTSERRLYDLRLDIPIPFRDELTWNRYGKSSYTSIPSSLEYDKEKDSNKGVGLGMEVKEIGADRLILAAKPFSGPVMKLLRWSFGDIIHACANSRNIKLAKQLMLQMQNLGLEPSCHTYDGFIRALVSVYGFRDGMEVLKIMQQKNKKPYDSTLAALSVSCSRSLELDLAEIFLAQISKYDNARPFNAFLKACYTLDQPERAVQPLAKMKYLNLLPDIRTYELLFSLFGNVNAPYEDGNMLSQVDVSRRINAIEMDMRRHGIQHSHQSLQNLLKALGMEGMTKEMIQYLQIAENQFSQRSCHLGIHIYNTILHALIEAKESHMAVEIFKSMISCGISPNALTYNVMVDCCSITKCYRSACALVSMMIRDGYCPHAVTYTALIKVATYSKKPLTLENRRKTGAFPVPEILLSFEDFDEALKLLDQASAEGTQPDLVLYNTILHVASQKGRIDVIELIVEQMHQEKIQPDPPTCSHVFSAYVNNDFHSTAMEALQVLTMRMISEEDSILKEIRLEYEDLILDEDLEAESRIIEVFKASPYIAVALLYLRWFVILGNPVSWLPNQSPWAKRLSINYASRHRG